jgi:hypothetical protein
MRFEADCGAHPASLTDVTLQTAPNSGIVWAGTGTDTRSISTLDWRGPYFAGLPAGELPQNRLTGGSTEGTDWVYDNSTTLLGSVSMPSSLNGSDASGTPFSEW